MTCEQDKPREGFPKHRSIGRGFGYTCKPCHWKRIAECRRKADPDKRREYARQYTWKFELKKRFGMTPEIYELMLATQGGGCAICGRKPGQQYQRLGVDHDHITGRVSALLCANCNTGIGMFEDNPERMRIAISYLERHK